MLMSDGSYTVAYVLDYLEMVIMIFESQKSTIKTFGGNNEEKIVGNRGIVCYFALFSMQQPG